MSCLQVNDVFGRVARETRVGLVGLRKGSGRGGAGKIGLRRSPMSANGGENTREGAQDRTGQSSGRCDRRRALTSSCAMIETRNSVVSWHRLGIFIPQSSACMRPVQAGPGEIDESEQAIWEACTERHQMRKRNSAFRNCEQKPMLASVQVSSFASLGHRRAGLLADRPPVR